jgi:hypothetical protein
MTSRKLPSTESNGHNFLRTPGHTRGCRANDDDDDDDDDDVRVSVSECLCGLNSCLFCFFQLEEQAEMKARLLKMRDEARKQINELRKLKK